MYIMQEKNSPEHRKEHLVCLHLGTNREREKKKNSSENLNYKLSLMAKDGAHW